MDRLVFRFITKKSVGFGLFFKETEKKRNRNRISLGRFRFGLHLLAKCEDMIVWCEVAFLQYLRLLRQTVRADTRTYNLPQTIAARYICYNNNTWYEGTRALG